MSKSSSSMLSAGRPSGSVTNKRKEATLASLADKPAMKRVNVDVTYEEHQKLKIHAVKEGKTISEVLRDYVAGLPE
nr:plasmid partition protein ParG [uncultured Halomonas sp.]